MGSGPQEIWLNAIADLKDGEAAELAVIALYKSQVFRPTIADVVKAYDAQRRLHGVEPPATVVPLFPARAGIPPTPGQAWSIEGARYAAGVQSGAVRHGVLYEPGTDGGPPVPTLREADIVRLEQQAQESYMALGSTSSERATAVMASLHRLVDADEPSVGRDSVYGRLCAAHNRWVGYAQTQDPCYKHVFADPIPEKV